MKITNTQELKNAEQDILDILNSSEGKILENENAVIALKQSQDLSDEIKFKQEAAKDTEERLERARQAYTDIANLAALLFFIVQKLHIVDVMYQYSLSWFIQLFQLTVENSQPPEVKNSSDSGSRTMLNSLNSLRRSKPSG